MTVFTELAATTRSVADAVGPAVVAIGTDARGSGFVVEDGKVLTNAHNLRDRTVSVHFADGRSAQGVVAGSDADGDLVVIAVNTAAITPLSWAAEVAGLGDTVFAVSRSLAGTSTTCGQISAVDAAFAGPRGRSIGNGLEHTAPLRRGSSGGPLLDAEGRVIGINTHRVDPGFYLARSADDALRDLVSRLGQGRSVRRPRIGVAVAGADVASRLRTAVGLPPIDGLLVREVEPGGVAATAGILVGDVLVSAGGINLTGPGVLLDALAAAGEVLAVHLVRGTTDVDVELVLHPVEGSPEA